MKTIAKTGCLLFILFVAAACGGGGGSSGQAISQSPPGQGGGGQSGGQAPQISGTPLDAIDAGTFYSFMPSATDPNGDSLTFSIANLPGWATFDPSTGEISGMPSSADAGTYMGIVISVSDGTTTTSLSPFDLLVALVGNLSVSISWTPPLNNEDGSSLSNLSAYKVYYGNAPDSYTRSVLIDQAGLATFVVEGLFPGEYYFSMTAINSIGVESDLSDEVSVTLTET